MNYNRIIQWTAGPVAIVAGYLATLLVAKVHILGALGYTQRGVAGAIVTGTTFTVSAGVTYAAHHKWLDNLAKWWNVLPQPPVIQGSGWVPSSSGGVNIPAGGPTPVGHPVGFTTDLIDQEAGKVRAENAQLRAQLMARGLTPEV